MNKAEIQKFDISRFSAGIIGCGGLGCNIIAQLAGAGIGRLILCDFDTVSPSNLNRQFLYTPEDIGKEKAVLAAKWVKRFSPSTEAVACVKKITSAEDMSVFADCDVILSAADNALPKRAANEYCTRAGIPLVCGGIDNNYGLACSYLPGKTPCLDCAGMTESSAVTASVGTTAGIIGSFEAKLAIDILINAEAGSGILYIYDNNEISCLKLRRTDGCSICNTAAKEGEENKQV